MKCAFCKEREAVRCNRCTEKELKTYAARVKKAIQEQANARLEMEDWAGQTAVLELLEMLWLEKSDE